MPIEIERKFLVTGSAWRGSVRGRQRFRQGYFNTPDHMSVRVRIIDAARATLTVKLPRSGLSRFEFEQEIALHEGLTLLDLCGGRVIEKNRYALGHEGSVWIVDSYLGENRGLVIAEIELADEDGTFAIPEWLGKEVTGIERYQNSTLARRPYSAWPEQMQFDRAV